MPSVDLEDLDLTDLAMCLRLGARKEREYAEAATSVSVKEIHLNGAKRREAFAKRLDAIRDRERRKWRLMEDQPPPK